MGKSSRLKALGYTEMLIGKFHIMIRDNSVLMILDDKDKVIDLAYLVASNLSRPAEGTYEFGIGPHSRYLFFRGKASVGNIYYNTDGTCIIDSSGNIIKCSCCIELYESTIFTDYTGYLYLYHNKLGKYKIVTSIQFSPDGIHEVYKISPLKFIIDNYYIDFSTRFVRKITSSDIYSRYGYIVFDKCVLIEPDDGWDSLYVGGNCHFESAILFDDNETLHDVYMTSRICGSETVSHVFKNEEEVIKFTSVKNNNYTSIRKQSVEDYAIKDITISGEQFIKLRRIYHG